MAAKSTTRRRFIQGLAIGTAAVSFESMFAQRGAFAEELTRTLHQTEGPFYPDKLPIDTDNDLLIMNDSITPAVGEVTHLSGKVLGLDGQPIRNALVEIWQVDSTGAYIHTRSFGREKADKNFQGYGRFLTGSSGEYYFRTIKPVTYPRRTPHIHVAVSQGNKRVLTTQLYIKGEPRNERDGILSRVRDAKQRAALLAEFKPLPDSRVGELTANWDVVVGHTPEDAPEPRRRR